MWPAVAALAWGGCPHAWAGPCEERAADWQGWSDENVRSPAGSPPEIARDKVLALGGGRRAGAERMLRRGLAACDPVAPRVAVMLASRVLVPDLRAAAQLGSGSPSFALQVVVALRPSIMNA